MLVFSVIISVALDSVVILSVFLSTVLAVVRIGQHILFVILDNLTPAIIAVIILYVPA